MEATPEHRAQQLRDSFAFQPAVYRRPLTLQIVLTLVSAVLISSMLLPWHRQYVAGGSYTIVYGIRGANWLLGIAAALMAIVARLAFRPVGYYIVFFIGMLAFLGLLGMSVDDIDNQSLAASLQVGAYYLSGFWVGLAGTIGLSSAAVLAWRERP